MSIEFKDSPTKSRVTSVKIDGHYVGTIRNMDDVYNVQQGGGWSFFPRGGFNCHTQVVGSFAECKRLISQACLSYFNPEDLTGVAATVYKVMKDQETICQK